MRMMMLMVGLSLIGSELISQPNEAVTQWLDELAQVENSKNLFGQRSTQQAIKGGNSVLPALIRRFKNQSTTEVYSECLNRKLTRGELAIILADHIERMPYAELTGVQNCTLTFCDRNFNFVEYYLDTVEKIGIPEFTASYETWLASAQRKEWVSLWE